MNLPPCEMWARVGSFHLGDPAFKDKDYLFLAFNASKTKGWFAAHGWEQAISDAYAKGFESFRKDERNAIVLSCSREFYGFLAAYHICKKYKIFSKSDRVLIHEAMRKRTYTPCDISFNQNTHEVTISAAFNSDRDQQASWTDDEPPY